ncbi:hypothetical protein Pcinc_005418 [Petrolisthes cinctipes]|uniref:Uncharacterized protein n=1 Tax=Petrolisthes cinctipes TaxID=88211 RepID=A0AAE1GDI4_PETCI|nr:hypothetical protein Pcinc_005418 [Petrolisthes cinctipes]
MMETFNKRPYDFGKRRVVVVEDEMSDDADSNQVSHRRTRTLSEAADERIQRQLSENVADLISTIRNDVKTRQAGNTKSYMSDAVRSTSQDRDTSLHLADSSTNTMQKRDYSYMDRDNLNYNDAGGNHSDRWTDVYRNRKEDNIPSKKLRTCSPLFGRAKLDFHMAEHWKDESTDSQDDEITNRHENPCGSNSIELSFEKKYKRRLDHDIPTRIFNHHNSPTRSYLRRHTSDSDDDTSFLDRFNDNRSRSPPELYCKGKKTDYQSVNFRRSRSPGHERISLRLDRRNDEYEEGEGSIRRIRQHRSKSPLRRRNSRGRVIAELSRNCDSDDNQSNDDPFEHRIRRSSYREADDSPNRNRFRDDSPPYKRRSFELDKRRESTSSNLFKEDCIDYRYERRANISSQERRSVSPRPWFSERSPSESHDSMGGYSHSSSRNIAIREITSRNRSRSKDYESPNRKNRNLDTDSEEDELYENIGLRNFRSRDEQHEEIRFGDTAKTLRGRWRGSRDLDSPDSDLVQSLSTRHEPSRYRRKSRQSVSPDTSRQPDDRHKGRHSRRSSDRWPRTGGRRPSEGSEGGGHVDQRLGSPVTRDRHWSGTHGILEEGKQDTLALFQYAMDDLRARCEQEGNPELRQALLGGWKDHERECLMFLLQPDIHPDYEKEYRLYINQQTKSLFEEGHIPDSFDYQQGWKNYWPGRMSKLFQESWENKVSKCMSKVSNQSSESRNNPDAKNENEEMPVNSKIVHILEVINPLKHKFGDLEKDYDKILIKALALNPDKKNSNSLIVENFPLFEKIGEKLLDILSNKNITLVQRAIIQESYYRFNSMIQMFIEKVPQNYGLDVKTLSRSTLGQDAHGIMTSIKDALLKLGHKDVTHKCLVRVYMEVKKAQYQFKGPGFNKHNLFLDETPSVSAGGNVPGPSCSNTAPRWDIPPPLMSIPVNTQKMESPYPVDGSYQMGGPYSTVGSYPNPVQKPCPVSGPGPMGGPYPTGMPYPMGGSYPTWGQGPIGGSYPMNQSYPGPSQVAANVPRTMETKDKQKQGTRTRTLTFIQNTNVKNPTPNLVQIKSNYMSNKVVENYVSENSLKKQEEKASSETKDTSDKQKREKEDTSFTTESNESANYVRQRKEDLSKTKETSDSNNPDVAQSKKENTSETNVVSDESEKPLNNQGEDSKVTEHKDKEIVKLSVKLQTEMSSGKEVEDKTSVGLQENLQSKVLEVEVKDRLCSEIPSETEYQQLRVYGKLEENVENEAKIVGVPESEVSLGVKEKLQNENSNNELKETIGLQEKLLNKPSAEKCNDNVYEGCEKELQNDNSLDKELEGQHSTEPQNILKNEAPAETVLQSEGCRNSMNEMQKKVGEVSMMSLETALEEEMPENMRKEKCSLVITDCGIEAASSVQKETLLVSRCEKKKFMKPTKTTEVLCLLKQNECKESDTHLHNVQKEDTKPSYDEYLETVNKIEENFEDGCLGSVSKMLKEACSNLELRDKVSKDLSEKQDLLSSTRHKVGESLDPLQENEKGQGEVPMTLKPTVVCNKQSIIRQSKDKPGKSKNLSQNRKKVAAEVLPSSIREDKFAEVKLGLDNSECQMATDKSVSEDNNVNVSKNDPDHEMTDLEECEMMLSEVGEDIPQFCDMILKSNNTIADSQEIGSPSEKNKMQKCVDVGALPKQISETLTNEFKLVDSKKSLTSCGSQSSDNFAQNSSCVDDSALSKKKKIEPKLPPELYRYTIKDCVDSPPREDIYVDNINLDITDLECPKAAEKSELLNSILFGPRKRNVENSEVEAEKCKASKKPIKIVIPQSSDKKFTENYSPILDDLQ